jgi:hypothetical protein
MSRDEKVNSNSIILFAQRWHIGENWKLAEGRREIEKFFI